MSLLITGSDTGVGKTVVTAVLAAVAQARGHSVCVYKPIQTGSPRIDAPEDPAKINAWLQTPVPVMNTYHFLPPVAPYVADTGRTIDLEIIRETCEELQARHDVVLVEGAGGVRVPIAPGLEMIDLIRRLGLPALVVVRPHLGTINHTLLTVEALQTHGIHVRGVVVSGYPPVGQETDPAITGLPEVFNAFLPVPVLGWLPVVSLSNLAKDHPAVQCAETFNIL